MSDSEGSQAQPFGSGSTSSSVIRSMLLVLLPLTLLPVLLMGSSAYLRARNLLREQVTDQLDSTIHAQSTLMENWVQRKQIRLGLASHRRGFKEILATLLENQGRTSEEQSLLREDLLDSLRTFTQLDSALTFNEFLVMSPTGEVLVASTADWEGLMVADPYLQQFSGLHQSLGIYSPSPLYDQELVVITSQPVTGPAGGLQATVLGISESVDILEVFKNIPLSHTAARPYFVSEQGEFIGMDPLGQRLIALQPDAEQAAVLLPLQGQYIHGDQPGEEHGMVDIPSFDGEPVTASFTWVPQVNLGLVVEVPQALIFGQLNSLGSFSIALVAGTVVILGLATWFATRQLVQPLLVVTDSIQKFAGGDWDQRVSLERDDEIGMLADTFNQLADALTSLYRSLGDQVEARSRQIRTAADVAQIATSTNELNELLERTVSLIVERFGYYQASVFLIDDAGEYAVLRESSGAAGAEMKARGHRLRIGSQSIIGWVTAHNESRIASEVSEDPVYFRNELLPETRSEVGVPISIANHVLGALDVQSVDPNAFDPESVAALQTLANQIASAIQKVRLLESTQFDLREMNLLYQIGREVASAETEAGVLNAVQSALGKTSIRGGLYLAEMDGFRLMDTDTSDESRSSRLAEWVAVPKASISFHTSLDIPLLISDPDSPAHPAPEFRHMVSAVGWVDVAYLPISVSGELVAMLVLGAREKGRITFQSLQPFAGLVEMAGITLEKVRVRLAIQKRLAEVQTLGSISQIISGELDFENLFELIFSQIRSIMGEVAFQIALYDETSGMIEVPFAYGQGQALYIEPFPIGPDLISHVITSRQPLMLVDNVAAQARRMGAAIIGEAARSWLGVPLIVAEEIVGVMAVQDLEIERRFGEDDLRLMTTLAAQIAVVIRNARLMETTQDHVRKNRLLHQVTSEAAASTSVEAALRATAQGLQVTLDTSDRASIYLYNPDQNQLELKAQAGTPAETAAGIPIGTGLTGWVGAHRQALLLEDCEQDQRPSPTEGLLRSALAVPLTYQNDLLGVLRLDSRQRGAFDENDKEMVGALSGTLAAMITNARLLERQRQLFDVTSKIRRSVSMQNILETTIQELSQAVGAQRVKIKLGLNAPPPPSSSGMDDPENGKRVPFQTGRLHDVQEGPS